MIWSLYLDFFWVWNTRWHLFSCLFVSIGCGLRLSLIFIWSVVPAYSLPSGVQLLCQEISSTIRGSPTFGVDGWDATERHGKSEQKATSKAAGRCWVILLFGKAHQIFQCTILVDHDYTYHETVVQVEASKKGLFLLTLSLPNPLFLSLSEYRSIPLLLLVTPLMVPSCVHHTRLVLLLL